MNPINNKVQVQEFFISNKQILVVRDDLCCPFPGNNNSKSRGVYQFLRNVDADVIGVLDTCVSRAGWGVAWLGRQLNKQVYLYVPQNCSDDFFRLMARLHGATIVPIKGNMSRVNYNVAKKDIERRGGIMLPLYLRLKETADEVSFVAANTLKRLDFKTIVVSVGSGTIVSGILRVVDINKVKVYGVSHKDVSIDERIKYIEGMSGKKGGITIIKYNYTYGDANYSVAPFPCDLYYDKWAWQWLVENVDKLNDPIVFWNVGGEWHHLTGHYPMFRGDGVTAKEDIDSWINSRRGVR